MRREVQGLLVRGRERLDDDAVSRWRIPAWMAEVLFLLPLLGSVVIALTILHTSLYLWVLSEDGLVEWLQVACFALGCPFALLAARRYWTTGDRGAALFFLLFAAGCLFVAGEEISWGQRLVGFETPEELKEANVQGEVNVHNVGPLRVAFKFAAIVLGLAGSVAPWLTVVRRRVPPAFLPPLFLSTAFFILFAYNFGRLVFDWEGFFAGGEKVNLTLGRYGEWTELALAYLVAAFAFFTWRRARAGGEMPPP